MDIHEILKQYPYISEDIRDNQDKLNMYIELKKQARNTLKGQELTGMPHGEGTSDTTYNAVEKIIDRYQTEIDHYTYAINDLLDLKRKMDTAVSTLSYDERKILFLKYERDMSLRKIGYCIHKGKDAVKEDIKKAINKIASNI